MGIGPWEVPPPSTAGPSTGEQSGVLKVLALLARGDRSRSPRARAAAACTWAGGLGRTCTRASYL